MIRRFQRSSGDTQHVKSTNGIFEISNPTGHRPATGKQLRQPFQLSLHPVNSLQQPSSLDDLYGRNRQPRIERSKTESSRKRRNTNPDFPDHERRTLVGFQGNRRVPSIHWMSGLRESKLTSVRQRKTFSLFVDNLPPGVARTWVRRLFERCGEVVNLFISTRIRKYTKACFGFVRYGSVSEAREAIAVLDGLGIQGKELRVSMAKFHRDGTPVSLISQPAKKAEATINKISKPAFRDDRRYSEVVAGAQKQWGRSKADMAEEQSLYRGVGTKAAVIPVFRSENSRYGQKQWGAQKQWGKRTQTCGAQKRWWNESSSHSIEVFKISGEDKAEMAAKEKVIPVFRSINVTQNMQTKCMLQRAIIAENTDVLHLPHITSQISACKVNETGIFSLSTTKILIVFGCEMDANNAVDMDSPLWNIFDDIRMWSEGEFFDDRLVWIDCIGMHPLCCSKENLKIIGELWGPVLHIDNKVQGIESITGARILIRTKAQNKIDNRIRLLYEHGSCDVWVKEHYGNCSQTCVYEYDKMKKPALEHVQNLGEGTLQCSLQNTHVTSSYDPLLQDSYVRIEGGENWSWVDPIVSNENIHWKNVASPDSHQNETFPISSPMNINKSSRPRGRPRKYSNSGILETRKTWETALRLGISADDEDAVLSGLRKSKRILIMEEKGE